MSSIFRARTASPSFISLMLITGTTALSTDCYVVALPQVQATLGTSSSLVQLTMTACIAGMAVGQLVTGPISDSRGRRGLILASTLVFTVMSIVCALATSPLLLIAARLLQGFACGAGAAVGRAVVTDVWRGRDAAAKFGTLSAVSLIAPVVGPVIGGVLLTFGSWRIIFWFLAVVGVLMCVGGALGLPETLPAESRHEGGLAQLVSRAQNLLTDRAFVTPMLVQCLTTAGFFIYIGGSSFVLQQGMGISEHLYTMVFGLNATTMVIASVIYRMLVLRVGPMPLRRAAMLIQTGAVVALFVVCLAPQPSFPLVWLCLSSMTFGLGFYLPSNSAITQEAGRRFGGTASALGGGIPYLAGSLTTPLTGLLGQQTPRMMASAMVVFFLLAGAAAIVLRQGTTPEVLDSTVEPEPTRERVAVGCAE